MVDHNNLRAPVAVFLICAALGGWLSCGSRPDPRLNVILISVDTFNRSSLRAFNPGALAQPNLDRFAAQSAVFANALAASSWTVPSHASLFTAVYPDRHGATDLSLEIAEGATPLTRALTDAGYEGVAFTGGGLLRWAFGYARGFDRYDGWTHPDYLSRVKLPRNGKAFPINTPGHFARAITFLSKRPSGGPPFFLFLHTFDVHQYFEVLPSPRDPLFVETDPNTSIV